MGSPVSHRVLTLKKHFTTIALSRTLTLVRHIESDAIYALILLAANRDDSNCKHSAFDATAIYISPTIDQM